MIKRLFRGIEWLLGATALVSLGSWGRTEIQSYRFQAASAAALEATLHAPLKLKAEAPPPVLRNWIGRLDVPRLGMSTIVVEGDDDSVLKLGVGHVPGTALPGQTGNAALAGHRDTFFRPLRNVRVGDEILWTSPEFSGRYRVESTEVVDPELTAALKPARGATLTLITCYPFSFIGSAPQRFVVHARLQVQ